MYFTHLLAFVQPGAVVGGTTYVRRASATLTPDRDPWHTWTFRENMRLNRTSGVSAKAGWLTFQKSTFRWLFPCLWLFSCFQKKTVCIDFPLPCLPKVVHILICFPTLLQKTLFDCKNKHDLRPYASSSSAGAFLRSATPDQTWRPKLSCDLLRVFIELVKFVVWVSG